MFIREALFRLLFAITMGLEASAVFEIANRVCLLLFNVITAGFTALYPTFSNFKHSKNQEASWILFFYAFQIMAGLGVWVMVQGIVFINVFFDVWLGGAEEQLISVTRILLIWYIVNLIFLPLWHLTNALGYEKFIFFIVAIHGTGGLSLFLLGLPVEWTLTLWVILGISAYGVYGFIGADVLFYVKKLLTNRLPIMFIFTHISFGGLAYYSIVIDLFRSTSIFVGLGTVYFIFIFLLSRNALKSFATDIFKRKITTTPR